MDDGNSHHTDPLGQLLRVAVVGWLIFQAGWLLVALPIILIIAWYIASLLA